MASVWAAPTQRSIEMQREQRRQSAGAALRRSTTARPRWRGGLQLAASLSSADPSLVTLPVFPLPSVLHPTQDGVLAGGLQSSIVKGAGACQQSTRSPLHLPTATHSSLPSLHLPCL